MKKLPLFAFIIFLSSACFADQRNHTDSWKNYYGLAWSGSGTESARYAKQMKYDYISLNQNKAPSYYNTDNTYSGLKFYTPDPHVNVVNYHFGYDSTIDTGGAYSQSQIDWYNQNMAWKGTSTFPNNLATGWWSSASVFRPMWDFQQQRVIDLVVDGIVSMVKAYDNPSIPFVFGGYTYDAPGGLGGDYNYWDGDSNVRVTIAYWTGTTSTLLHDDITHEYSTYSDGMAVFFKELQRKTKREFAYTKWIIHPWRLYNSTSPGHSVYDEWIYQVKGRTDKDELTPDMLIQETMNTGYETYYVDDSNIFSSGMAITKSMVGTHNNKKVSDYLNRLVASKSAINGAWNNWFGSFGGGEGGENMPSFNYKVEQVYPRLKLSRCIQNWCNLAGVGTPSTSWDGNTFMATHTTLSGNAPFAFIGTYTMYATHWQNPYDKFVVKMGTNTELYEPVVIGDGFMVKEIYSTNDWFEPVANVKDTQWTKTGNSWQINAGIVTGDLTDVGVGYIFKVYPNGGYSLN